MPSETDRRGRDLPPLLHERHDRRADEFERAHRRIEVRAGDRRPPSAISDRAYRPQSAAGQLGRKDLALSQRLCVEVVQEHDDASRVTRGVWFEQVGRMSRDLDLLPTCCVRTRAIRFRHRPLSHDARYSRASCPSATEGDAGHEAAGWLSRIPAGGDAADPSIERRCSSASGSRATRRDRACCRSPSSSVLRSNTG